MEYPGQSQIVLKIEGGTTRGGKSLCVTCRNAHIIRGQNNQQQVICGAGTMAAAGRLMQIDVAECNRYYDATKPALYEMEEIAWRLVTDRAKSKIGFVDPVEWNRQRLDQPPR